MARTLDATTLERLLDATEPIHVVEMLQSEGGPVGTVPTTAELDAVGAERIYAGRTHPAGYGHTAWRSVDVIRYPNGAAFTSLGGDTGDSRPSAIDGRQDGSLVYCFTPGRFSIVPDGPITPSTKSEVFVVNLLRFGGAGGRKEYVEYSKVSTRLMAERQASAVIYLDGDVPLETDQTWDAFILVNYPSLDALIDMNQTSEWKRADTEHRQAGLSAGTYVVTTPI